MANEVYANSMEVACKAAQGKSICAFPDVCFTPPQTPATPPGVPIPYPNTGFASDTTDGSKTVQISGKEVMLKNKSHFKKSTGDEAGSAPKKGVITSKNTGKVYFNAWSMDVKFEGENVVRNLDLTTHNHASFPGDTPTWPYLDKASVDAGTGPCAKEMAREKEACKEYEPHKKGGKDACKDAGLTATDKPGREYDVDFEMPSGTTSNRQDALAAGRRANADACLRARRCMLQPYSPNGCCPGQTPHHLIEASALHDVGRGKPKKNKKTGAITPSIPLKGVNNYEEGAAPCVCAEGVTQHSGTHGLMHSFQSAANADKPQEVLEFANGKKESFKATTYAEAKDNACAAMQKAFPYNGCSDECIKKQLDNYHNQCGVTDSTKIKAVEEGKTDAAALEHATEDAQERAGEALGDRFSEGAHEGDYSWMND